MKPDGENSGTVPPRHAVRKAVPFFGVRDMEASLRFYEQGLGFIRTCEWAPEGRIRWCWMELDRVAFMLQEYTEDRRPEGTPGVGVSICLFCEDARAIYRDLRARGIAAERPFVGNGLWVTTVRDPDGYRIDFESPAEEPEETVYSESAE